MASLIMTTTPTTPSKATISTTSIGTSPFLVSPGTSSSSSNTANNTIVLPSMMSNTTTTTTTTNNNDVSLLLLSLETTNEELRNIFCQDHVQQLLIKVHERSLQMEYLTKQNLHYIQNTIQQLQNIQIQLSSSSSSSSSSQQQQEEVEVVDADETNQINNNNNNKLLYQQLNDSILQHQLRRRTLQQHTATSLLELLELPSLMDACIKQSTTTTSSSNIISNELSSSNNNNEYYYDEAIQIAAFANTLERRHGISSCSTTSDTNIPSSNNNNNTPNNNNNNNNNGNSIIHQVITQIRIRQDELRQHLIVRLQHQQPQYQNTTGGGSNNNNNNNNNQSNTNHTTTTTTTTNTTMMMNECLEIITALRRLNTIDLERYQYYNYTTKKMNMNMEQAHAMSEYQLQIAFLEARDTWLDTTTHRNNSINTSQRNLITSSSSSSSVVAVSTTISENILDIIERYRTRMFEIATQYNAIFTTTTTTTTTTTNTNTSSTNTIITSAQQLLSLWITRRIQYFLKLLRHELTICTNNAIKNATTTTTTTTTTNNINVIDTAMVRDAIEASVFFATSLGRLGGDFTCQLMNIFEPIILQIITQQYWIPTIQQFHHTLEICRDAGIATPLSTMSTSGIDNVMDTNNKYDDIVAPSRLDEPQPPPKRLLALPPLARFVNGILIGLNELRRCLLPGIFVTLRHFIQTNVIDIIQQELELNERMVLIPGLRGDAVSLRIIAVQMKNIFCSIVIPYLLGSLEAAIGYKDGAIKYHTQLYSNIQKLQEHEQQQQQKRQGAGSEEEVKVEEEEEKAMDHTTNIEPPSNDDTGITLTDGNDVANDDEDLLVAGRGDDDDDDDDNAQHNTAMNTSNDDAIVVETAAVTQMIHINEDEEVQQQK